MVIVAAITPYDFSLESVGLNGFFKVKYKSWNSIIFTVKFKMYMGINI